MSVSSSRIAYATRSETTPESEISTLANIYRYILNCAAKKEATHPGSPDDAERRSNDGARDIMQDTK
jgi:hypothetical protein